jgi:hypothetical protein
MAEDVQSITVTQNDTVLVIIWNRITNEFEVTFSGIPMHYSSVKALLAAVTELLKETVDEEGICRSKKEKKDIAENVPAWLREGN